MKNCIDYKNDATSECFADTSRSNNNFTEMNSPLSCDNRVVSTMTEDYVDEIEYTGIAEEIVIEDESDFYSLSPNSDSSESKISKEDRSSEPMNDGNISIPNENNSVKCIIIDNSTSTSPQETVVSNGGDHTYELSRRNTTESTDQPAPEVKISATEGADKPYKCHICGKSFSRNSSLKCHIRLHVEGPDNMLRNTSAPTSTTMTPLKYENASENVFCCVICSKKFSCKKTLKHHIRSHTSTDSKPDADGDASGSECNHEENENSGRDYKCIMCNKRFSRRSSLTFHYKFHPVEKSPPSKKSLDSEVSESNSVDDSNSKQYECSDCGKKFPRFSNLKSHMKSHVNNARKKSNDSETSEKSDSVSEDHRMEENGSTYKCRKCDQSFSRLGNLKLHMAIHKDIRLKSTDEANDSNTLFEHLYEEVSSRNYTCSNHNHNHTGEVIKFYKCNLCQKCFCEFGLLKKHITRYHKDYVDDLNGADSTNHSKSSKGGSSTRQIYDKTVPNSSSSKHKRLIKDCHGRITIPGLYKCGVCNEAFDEIEFLKDHVIVHLGAEFRCGVCDQFLPSKNELKNHLLEHEEKSSSKVTESNGPKDDEFLCVVCDRAFNTANGLQKHMNCHRKVEEELIPRVSSSGRRIKDPRSRENDFAYNSDKLHKSSPIIRDKFASDVEEEGANEKPISNPVTCTGCGKVFGNRVALRFHLVRKPECAQNVPSVSPVPRMEEKSTFSEAKDRDLDSLKCSCCDRRFTSISALCKHVSNHSKGVAEDARDDEENAAAGDGFMNLLKCDRCDKFFRSIPSLKLHILSEHAKNPTKLSTDETASEGVEEVLRTFKCDICGEKFNDEECLDEHMNSHEELKMSLDEANELRCDRCHKIFPALKSLNIHRGRYCRGEVEKYGDKEEENDGDEEDSDTDGTGRLECCDEVFDTEKAFHAHRARFCSKADAFVCCNRRFANARALHNHKFRHKVKATGGKDEEPKSLTCECCKFTFASIKSLKVHLTRKAKAADENETCLRKCSRCDKYFINSATLNAHMAEHSEEEDDSEEEVFVSLRCDICDKTFKTNKAMRKHRATHTEEEDSSEAEGDFKCVKCGKVFQTERSLRVHRAYHTKVEKSESLRTPVNEKSEYPCSKCDRIFTSGSALGGHMTSHPIKTDANTEEITEYPCLRCDQIFNTLEEVADHKTVHENETTDDEDAEEYQCPKCDRSFASRKGLGAHKRVHGYDTDDETEQFACLKCDRSFPTRKGLITHNRIHGYESSEEDEQDDDLPETNEFQCTLCDRSFSTHKGLAKHVHIHKTEIKDDEEESPYQCLHCERSFPTRKGRTKHMNVHKNVAEENTEYPATEPEPESMDVDEYPCPHCDRTFATIKGVRKHKSVCKLKSEHKNDVAEEDGVEPTETGEYQCNLCDRRFHSTRGLAIHKSSHKADLSDEDENTYSCKICDSTFSNDKALNAHMKKHLREITSSEEHDHGAKDKRKSRRLELSCTIEDTVEDEGNDVDKHRCDMCQLSFPDLRSLSKHCAIHENVDKDGGEQDAGDFKELRISIHQCKMCDEAFTDHVSLQDHSMIHNCDTMDGEVEKRKATIECPYCPRLFTTAQGLKRHSTTHKNEIKKAKKMALADKNLNGTVASNVDDSVEQIETTINIDGSILDTTTPSIAESSIDRVDTTMDAATSANSTVVEPIQISLNLSEIAGPTNGKVGTAERLKCDRSDDEAVQEARSLECNICGRQFDAPKLLKRHLMFHKFNDFAEDTEIAKTNELLECDLCSKKFESEDDLKHHRTFHGVVANGCTTKSIGPVLRCELCDETFTRIVALKSHSEEVHGKTITGEITFKCEQCDERFTKASAFMLHKKYHRSMNETSPNDDPMPFECISCEKCFRFKDHLLEHVKTHTDGELVLENDLELLVEETDQSDELVEKTTSISVTGAENQVNDDVKIDAPESEKSTIKVEKNNPIVDKTVVEYQTVVPTTENQLPCDSKSNEPKETIPSDIHPSNDTGVNVKNDNIALNDMEASEDFELKIEDDDTPVIEKAAQVGPYSCTLCDRKFLFGRHLGSHLKAHRRVNKTSSVQVQPLTPLRSSTKQFQCMVCGLKFRLEGTLALHCQTHSQSNQKKALKRLNNRSDPAEDEGVRSKRKSVSRC